MSNIYGLRGISNNVDTSATRASEIVRENKKIQLEIKKAAEKIVESFEKGDKLNSPYASDRKVITDEQIHKTEREMRWKKVESEAKSRENISNEEVVKESVTEQNQIAKRLFVF